MAKRCPLIAPCCWHYEHDPLEVDTRPKGCQIARLELVKARKCCKCGRVQGYKSYWDETIIYHDSAW